LFKLPKLFLLFLKKIKTLLQAVDYPILFGLGCYSFH